MHILIISDFTENGLFEIAKTEIKKYIKDNPVNAITVGFYTNEADIGSGYTHGKVVYAPNGSVADASKVTTGDYSTFKFSNQINTFQFSAGIRPEIFSQVMDIKSNL